MAYASSIASGDRPTKADIQWIRYAHGVVQAEKRRRASLGLPIYLTPEELDALLPGAECFGKRARRQETC